MPRNKYDLSHVVHMCGKIGRLQTLGVHVVGPGDSLELQGEAILRLSKLRKEIVQDAQVDIMGFYQPLRHIYGDDWIDLIKQGTDEAKTLTGETVLAGSSLEYLGLPTGGATAVPKWLHDMYFNIYNYYFKHPDYPDIAPSVLTGDDALYGLTTARLKHPATNPRKVSTGTGIKDLDAADFTLPIPVSGTANLDIRDLARVRGQARSEIEANWFSSRYAEIMKQRYKTTVNYDTDERPEMLFRVKEMFSGHDVDGTDDATLGNYVGKTVTRLNPSMPRKYFDEHGIVWFMAVVRFPFIHVNEYNYLNLTVNPTWAEIGHDPDIIANEEPIAFDAGRYVSGSAAISGHVEPFGQWHRYAPSRVHYNFYSVDGYPFERQIINTAEKAFYNQNDQQNDVFGTTQLGHWQLHGLMKMNKYTRVPGALSSIYAGVK